MAITTTQRTHLNNMNRAAHDPLLGNIIYTLQTGSATLNGFIRASGSVSVSSAQASASKVTVATGLTGIVGFIVQCFTSGSIMTGMKVINSGSNLDITCGSATTATPPALAANDAVNWIVW